MRSSSEFLHNRDISATVYDRSPRNLARLWRTYLKCPAHLKNHFKNPRWRMADMIERPVLRHHEILQFVDFLGMLKFLTAHHFRDTFCVITLNFDRAVNPELSMGPFCVTQSNPTHQLTDPTQPTRSGKIWTQPDTTNKFNCLMQPNLI